METLVLEPEVWPLNGNLIHFGRAQQFSVVSHSLLLMGILARECEGGMGTTETLKFFIHN